MEEKMKKNILLGLVLPIFLLAIFAGGALAAEKPRVFPMYGPEPPGKHVGPSPVMHEEGMQPDPEDINPDPGVVVIQLDQWGMTFYDEQQVGSMGRMIAVGPGGHRHVVFHETQGPFGPAFPRYVTYNCKDPLDAWLGPTWIDGGPDINAGYPQMLVMHDGREIILYHRTEGTPTWWSTLAVGDEGFIGQGYFTNLYDLPDKHDDTQTGDYPGMWPKGCIVYDAETDTDYIHIVTTESAPGAGDNRSIAYQRCVFQGDNLVCISPGGLGPYTRVPNVAGNPDDEIAVFDFTGTFSAVAVSSPVSHKMAIVYTKPEEGGITKLEEGATDNDVYYIESTNNGVDWLNGTPWPPTIYNVTDYEYECQERAFTDVAACYDYNDNLHIVWNSCYYDPDSPTSNKANLMHWCDTSPLGFDNATLVAPDYWGGTDPGTWNRNICKMSIAAKDPIYHPGGEPDDSVFLFCNWTQFDPGDTSLAGYGNGDIYASVSPNAGTTWTRPYNLTGTHTPDCAPGECLSEHWSSLAENIYDGDLHIEYVCDRDAGAIVQDEGSWTDNSMMYMHVEQLPVEPHCGVFVTPVDPLSLCDPPLKVPPDGYRIITFKIEGIYNSGGDYGVTTDHPKVTCISNCSGFLGPGEQIMVEFTISCEGKEEFINATITFTVCIGTEDETTYVFPLHAVCSDDYYECDRDPATWIIKDNCKCSLWVCANTEERVWDKRIAEEEKQQVIFSGGVIVATTEGTDTVVGRQDYRDTRTGARDIINVVQGYDYFQPECDIQMIYVKNTFICANHLEPPNHLKWWWIDIHKKIIFFHDRPSYECPNWKKEQIIKKMWIDYSEPPVWWPDQSPYTGHEDIYFGYFADIDAPFDDGCSGCNTAGYGDAREMVWMHGWYNGLPDGHPEYEDHYVGLAFTDVNGAVVTPFGMQCVRNDIFLSPQDGWGWKEGELYDLAATPGVNIQDPGLVVDRTVVMTADMIPAGTEDDFFSHFILIEASIAGNPSTGLAELQAHIDQTRGTLIPELRDLDILEHQGAGKVFPICGDVNEDGKVNVADVVYLATYLFQNGPPPSWPMNRADVNNTGLVAIGDLVYLVTYLFADGPPPNCSGFGRE
jgi:hypothetical protein